MTRRALLGAAALVVAGCGPPEEPEIVPADVLGEQLRAASEALAAYEGVGDVARERAVAAARVERLADAVRHAGGVPSDPASGMRSGLAAALAAERSALRAHVEAIGRLGEREWRELLGELIAGGAQSEAALLTKLGRRPSESAFPGEPLA